MSTRAHVQIKTTQVHDWKLIITSRQQCQVQSTQANYFYKEEWVPNGGTLKYYAYRQITTTNSSIYTNTGQLPEKPINIAKYISQI